MNTSKGIRVRYLKKDQIWSFFLDICKGLEHLHKHNIIHRDLKPGNLLMHFDGVKYSVLLSDFGESEVVSSVLEEERTGATGTIEFMVTFLLFFEIPSNSKGT